MKPSQFGLIMKHCHRLLVGFACVLVLFSCTEEEVVVCKLNTLPIQLFTMDTLSLDVSPVTSGWIFSSKNEHIASVSDSGLVTAHIAGTTTLYARFPASGFVDSVTVTVKPRATFFQEPYLSFFVPQQTIIDFEERDSYAIGWGERWFCAYYARVCGVANPMTLVYYFTANDEYAFSSMCFNVAFETDVKEHVSERFLFVQDKTEADRTYSYYIKPDSSTILETYSIKNELWLFYHPYSKQAMEAIQNGTMGMVFDR